MINSLSSGGAERFVVDLSNQLAESGHDVYVCMLLDTNEERLVFNRQFLTNKVHFISLRFSRGWSLQKCHKVSNYIKKINPDIVHCHLNILPYIFHIALNNNKIRFFHTLHSLADNCVNLRLQYYVNRWYYKTERIFPVTISNECKVSYEQFYHLYNAPYINNGRAEIIPSDNYNDVKKEISIYQASNTTPVFIHVARFHPQKNQSLLIDSFNELNKRGLDFTLLIIGNKYDCDEAKSLKEKACGKIHFLGEKSNIGDYLLNSDAFCLTSTYEGLPISLLEALACGVTPICTNVGGIPNVIKEGDTGYLSQDFSVESYVAAIDKFLNGKPIPKEKLKLYFKENYSMKSCAKKYVALFNQKQIS